MPSVDTPQYVVQAIDMLSSTAAMHSVRIDINWICWESCDILDILDVITFSVHAPQHILEIESRPLVDLVMQPYIDLISCSS